MSALTASPNDVMRRALVAMDTAAVLTVVDAMNLQGVKLPANVAMPLKSLQKKHDIAGFAAASPIDAVSGLLELLSAEPLEQIIEILGDHSENPSYEQLRDAVATLREGGATRNDVIALLAFAAGQEFPAAPSCRQILHENDEYTLPELVITAGTSSLLNPKKQDDAVLEQRKARREEEKARKKAREERARLEKERQAAIKAEKIECEKAEKARALAEKEAKEAAAAEAAALAAMPIIIPRRSVTLTPAESKKFSAEHPLAGWLVMADVPFDAVDPEHPDQHSKVRPAVVLAGNETQLLVAGVYSEESPSRSLFQGWRRAGLDHASYVDSVRVTVNIDDEVRRVLELSVDEWNSLI